MKANELEHYWNISMPILKKRRFLRGSKSGAYIFRDYRTGMIDSVHIEVVFNKNEGGWIRFKYSYQYANGRQELDYTIPLVTTKCRYGGVRYWFRCNHTKDDGAECKNRVSVLYLKEGRFACRECHKLIYGRNNLKKDERKRGKITPISKLQEMGKEIKKCFYKDKPTKRYARYVKLKKQSEVAIEGSFTATQKQFDDVGKKFGFKI
jgi:hypothetical protein